jgi:hypothetical protein
MPTILNSFVHLRALMVGAYSMTAASENCFDINELTAYVVETGEFNFKLDFINVRSPPCVGLPAYFADPHGSGFVAFGRRLEEFLPTPHLIVDLPT